MLKLKELIYEFYRRLNETIHKEIKQYPIGIRKVANTHYIIGDHVELYDPTNPFFGGAKNNQFLLYISHIQSRFISIHENRNYTLPSEKIFQFADEILTNLTKEKDYNGIILLDFKNYQKNAKEMKKMITKGDNFIELVQLAMLFPKIDKIISHQGSYQWIYNDYSNFQIEIKEDGLLLNNGKRFPYKEKIKSEEDMKKIITILDEREEKILKWKEEINQLIASNENSKWNWNNSLQVGEKRIYHIRNIIVNGKFHYSFLTGYGKEKIFQTTEQMLDSARRIIKNQHNIDND